MNSVHSSVCVFFFLNYFTHCMVRSSPREAELLKLRNFIEHRCSLSMFTCAYCLCISEGWMIFQVRHPTHFCHLTSADSVSKLTRPVRCDCFSVNLTCMESALTSLIHFTFCRSVVGASSSSEFCHIKNCCT